MNVGEIVEKQQILDDGYESFTTFGNCLVYANDTTLIFWHPFTKKITNICKREY